MSEHAQLFVGTFVDTPKSGQLRVRQDHLLAINKQGFISHLAPASDSSSTAILNDHTVQPTHLGRSAFLLPTFADLHLHAPQYLYAGTGLDLPLMEWLDRYTYPAEESIDRDPQLARKVYRRLCQRLREEGTGAVVLFGTVGVEANLILAQELQTAGIRGWVGKLSMDQCPRPTYGEPSTEACMTALRSFLDSMAALTDPLPPHQRLVQPILTPRFVPTCSDGLLRELGRLAKEERRWVTSHMCESRDQMDWVESTRGKRDEVVFDEAGLLGPRTIQAHVTSFPPELRQLVKARGVTAAHCPLSNAYFSDAVFPLREALDEDVSVGLGSDISGGYALGIQSSMRHAVVAARLREGARKEAMHAGTSASRVKDDGKRVHWVESMYVATRGGKKALELGGAFEVGMEFDAQLIQVAGEGGETTGQLDLFSLPENPDEQWWIEVIEKWWCNGTPANRVAMWTQGKKLG